MLSTENIIITLKFKDDQRALMMGDDAAAISAKVVDATPSESKNDEKTSIIQKVKNVFRNIPKIYQNKNTDLKRKTQTKPFDEKGKSEAKDQENQVIFIDLNEPFEEKSDKVLKTEVVNENAPIFRSKILKPNYRSIDSMSSDDTKNCDCDKTDPGTNQKEFADNTISSEDDQDFLLDSFSEKSQSSTPETISSTHIGDSLSAAPHSGKQINLEKEESPYKWGPLPNQLHPPEDKRKISSDSLDSA